MYCDDSLKSSSTHYCNYRTAVGRGWFGALKTMHVRAEKCTPSLRRILSRREARMEDSVSRTLAPAARSCALEGCRWRVVRSLQSKAAHLPSTSACRIHHQVKVSAGAPRASFEHASLLTRPMAQGARPPRCPEALPRTVADVSRSHLLSSWGTSSLMFPGLPTLSVFVVVVCT